MAVNNVDYGTLTVGTASVGMADASPAMPSRAKGAVITVEDAQIRYRGDGTAPTATEGHVFSPGDPPLTFDSWTAPGNNYKQVLNAIRFIRSGGADGKLKISWYD